MNEKELKRLLTSGETETVEFKEIVNDSFFKTISAFANEKDGIILLGVDKKGSIKGVEPSGEFLESLTNRIIDSLAIYPEIETIDISENRVMAVKVTHSSYPVSYKGRYYERVGNTTREMSPEKLRAVLLRGKPWDSLPGNFSLKEIDTETVSRFVSLAVEKRRLTDISLNDPAETVLKKLQLIADGQLTNGALLLFGKNPQKYYINLCARIGRFKTETIIIDDKWEKGNLFQQFDETVGILKQLISVRYEIKDFEREDIWDYPIPALREAVLNALIHRDYFDIANFTLVKVYDDRIWFSNPGKLVEGITIDELKKPHKSYLRNPLIAKVFYLCGYIEQYGSGTVRMVEWMKEAGLPEPEYKEEMGGFSVYFYKDIYTEENLRKMELNKRQIKAVMYIKEKGKITNREYQEANGVSRQTATRELSYLANSNILLKHGKTGRDTYYTLVRKTAENINASQTPQTPNKRLTNASKGTKNGNKEAAKAPHEREPGSGLHS